LGTNLLKLGTNHKIWDPVLNRWQRIKPFRELNLLELSLSE
jgi:hypothetical protein